MIVKQVLQYMFVITILVLADGTRKRYIANRMERTRTQFVIYAVISE